MTDLLPAAVLLPAGQAVWVLRDMAYSIHGFDSSLHTQPDPREKPRLTTQGTDVAGTAG